MLAIVRRYRLSPFARDRTQSAEAFDLRSTPHWRANRGRRSFWCSAEIPAARCAVGRVTGTSRAVIGRIGLGVAVGEPARDRHGGPIRMGVAWRGGFFLRRRREHVFADLVERLGVKATDEAEDAADGGGGYR